MKRLEVLEDLNGQFVGEAEGESLELDGVSTIDPDYILCSSELAIARLCHQGRD